MRSRRRARHSAGPIRRSTFPTTFAPPGPPPAAAPPPAPRGRRGCRRRFRFHRRVDLPDRSRGAGDRRVKGRPGRRAAEIASRASQNAIEALVAAVPSLIVGSADLTAQQYQSVGDDADHRRPTDGNYLYYGVREHAMAAAMNGMALHGGVIPAGVTFLVFTDYCRPSIRLAALMGLGCIYVMTHDPIGLGEDGLTHQPVEHLAALRAIPTSMSIDPPTRLRPPSVGRP